MIATAWKDGSVFWRLVKEKPVSTIATVRAMIVLEIDQQQQSERGERRDRHIEGVAKTAPMSAIGYLWTNEVVKP